MSVPVQLTAKPPPVDERFRSDRHALFSLVMLITEQCNLRCDYCYIRKVPRRMSDEIADASVDFLLAHAAPAPAPVSICYFGGEPLLEPRLVERIHAHTSAAAAAQGRSATFTMTSNATLLNERNAALIERLGIGLRVSLDGIGAAHDRHRRTVGGKGSFRLIERNLDRIALLPGVSVRLTVGPETAASLPESIAWLVDRGFKRIAFSPVTEAAWTAPAAAALLEGLVELRRLQQSFGNGASISNITKTDGRLGRADAGFGCGAARGMVAVDASGFVYPCHRFIGYFENGPAQRIGDVRTGFDTTARERYIAANHISNHTGCGSGLFRPDVAPAERACGSCSLHSVCGTACMALNEHLTGDPRRPHPVNRLLAQVEAAAHLAALDAGFASDVLSDHCNVS